MVSICKEGVKDVMHRRIASLVVTALVLSVLGGCSGDSSSKEARMSLFQSVDQDPVYLGDSKKAPLDEIKKKVASHKEIYDVAVVQKDKDILVGYKVKHMQRFRMKSIESNLKDDLQKNFKDYNFTVSSDMKIFLETVELIVNVKNKGYSKKKAEKWFDKIMELQKDMA